MSVYDFWVKVRNMLLPEENRLKIRLHHLCEEASYRGDKGFMVTGVDEHGKPVLVRRREAEYWFIVPRKHVKRKTVEKHWYMCWETDDYSPQCERCPYWFWTYYDLGGKIPAMCLKTKRYCVLHRCEVRNLRR